LVPFRVLVIEGKFVRGSQDREDDPVAGNVELLVEGDHLRLLHSFPSKRFNESFLDIPVDLGMTWVRLRHDDEDYAG
jgi:hypothetical protein